MSQVQIPLTPTFYSYLQNNPSMVNTHDYLCKILIKINVVTHEDNVENESEQ